MDQEISQKIQALRAEANRLEEEERLTDSLPRCPFCGGAPRILEFRGEWDSPGEGKFVVKCKDCGCSTKEQKGRDNAVYSWRRRV